MNMNHTEMDYLEKSLIKKQIPLKNRTLFSNGYSIEIDKYSNQLKVFNQGEKICLHIILTEKGPVLNFESANIRLKSKENLMIESGSIHLKAEKKITIECKGDYTENVEGDITSEARIQKITARLGNVNIKANDDVRLDGERVKLNCSE